MQLHSRQSAGSSFILVRERDFSGQFLGLHQDFPWLIRLWYNQTSNHGGDPVLRMAQRRKMLSVAMLVLAFGLSACSSASRPAGEAAPAGGSGEASAPAGSDPVARALDAALARRGWNELRIESECLDDDGRLRFATLYGSGVGIWNRDRQFDVPRERLLALLEELGRAGFGAMREIHGGKDDPAPAAPARWAPRLTCRVSLALDGTEKQSYQLAEGRQSAELKALAEKVLAVAEELGPQGVTAASLEDGLAKIARGELAPETLMLQLQRQPENPSSPEGGWMLRVRGDRAEVSRFTPAEGWSEPRHFQLSRAEVAGLARRLAETALEGLPVNLYAPAYYDFEVQTLNHKRSLQARGFAGVTPETHGEKQKRFDQLLAALEDLRKRGAGEG